MGALPRDLKLMAAALFLVGFGAAIGFAVLGFLSHGNLENGAGWSTLFWLYTVTALG